MTESGSEKPTPKGRILAVEDEPAIRRFYRRFFESQDYELVLAPTGTAALEILRAGEPFDAILLDIRLPGVSGRGVWKYIEMERPELCSRVILVSGDILGEGTQQLIEETGRPYLEKPFSTPDLLDAIERVRRAMPGNSGTDARAGGA